MSESTLELLVLGTAGPMHGPLRFGPAQVITDGSTNILVDTGWSSTLRLYQAGLPPQRIDSVFFTHLHSDHTTDMADFLVMRWVGGISTPIPVYGPTGTAKMVAGFQQAMAEDTKFRLAHHGEKLWSGGLECDVAEIEAGEEPVVIATIGEITVKAFAVDHRPVMPAYGFRFEKGGKSITISGDTNACPGLLNGSRDADILVCDSMNLSMMGMLETNLRGMGNEIQASLLVDAHDYHASTEDVARLAKEAGVKHLVLSHLLPSILVAEDGPSVAQFTAGMAEIYGGKITVAKDLMRIAV